MSRRHEGTKARRHEVRDEGSGESEFTDASLPSPSLRASVPSCLRACSFDLSRLRREIKPFKLHWFPRLRSTNDHAAALRERGELYAPAVVVSGHQMAGRGRGGNSRWWGRGA